MKTPSKLFKNELEVFRKETESGTQFFYSYLAINGIITSDEEALNIVNESPLFWGTNIGALHLAFFIVLGRIFDQKSVHNVDKLLKIAQDNSAIFSKIELGERKRQGHPTDPEWLPEYLERSYEPTAEDFRRLRRHIKKHRNIYNKNYRDIRNKIHAHKELSKKSDTRKLFSKTKILEVEKIFLFLNQLHEALWELYNNGRKPILRPRRYSIRQMMKKRRPNWKSKGVHEKIVNDAQKFFNILKSKTQ